MRKTCRLVVLLCLAACLSGCYYTATGNDGVTRPIDRKAYDQLKDRPKATRPAPTPVQP